MNSLSSSVSSSELQSKQGIAFQSSEAREKSKRPQLSCRACRARKVRCDRVQPCTACSLHQIADLCHYDLTDSERHPILQAEALRAKDREIDRLRHEISALGGSVARTDLDTDADPRQQRRPGFGEIPPKRPGGFRVRHPTRDCSSGDGSRSPAPHLKVVVKEFAELALRSKAASMARPLPHESEPAGFDMTPSYPFPTLWKAKEGAEGLLSLLPSRGETSSCLNSFQKRAQGFSFPYSPRICTKGYVESLFGNPEHSALLHPDMLALLFATLAQGLQHGVYDRSGERWVAGTMEDALKKGDVLVAASFQALRLSTFLSRPSLYTIEALLMIGQYLTDSGKFLDAFSLFGTTIRLAQAMRLHQNPELLQEKCTAEDSEARKALWSWMLHSDQQFSTFLSRPLGVSASGDCPRLLQSGPVPVAQSLDRYRDHLTTIARQFSSCDSLGDVEIDRFTDQLHGLRLNLPDAVRFEDEWLQPEKAIPPWPLNARAAILHSETHNLLCLLNQRRSGDGHLYAQDVRTTHGAGTGRRPRGYDAVLASCRQMLQALEFFRLRVRAGILCWTVCQAAFNAARLLILAMLETGDTRDFGHVRRAYNTFFEIARLGLHRLAGVAVERLAELIDGCQNGQISAGHVMSNQGMALLENSTLPGHITGSVSGKQIQTIGMASPRPDRLVNVDGRQPISHRGTTEKPSKKMKMSNASVTAPKSKSSTRKNQRKEPNGSASQTRAVHGPSRRHRDQSASPLNAQNRPSSEQNQSQSSTLFDQPGIDHPLNSIHQASMNAEAFSIPAQLQARPAIVTSGQRPVLPQHTAADLNAMLAAHAFSATLPFHALDTDNAWQLLSASIGESSQAEHLTAIHAQNSAMSLPSPLHLPSNPAGNPPALPSHMASAPPSQAAISTAASLPDLPAVSSAGQGYALCQTDGHAQSQDAGQWSFDFGPQGEVQGQDTQQGMQCFIPGGGTEPRYFWGNMGDSGFQDFYWGG